MTDTVRSYGLNFHPVPHGVTVSCERYTVGFPVSYGSPSDVFVLAAASYIYIHYALKRSGRRWRVTLHVHTRSGRNRIIPLMRRRNTDSTPNKPVTLPRNQLLIRYVVTSPVHTVTIRCYVTRKRYKCVPTLRRRSAAVRLPGLWVRIPLEAWMLVCCLCCVLTGSGFCDELITRPEESYRLWCVVACDLETSWMRRPWLTGGCRAKKQTNKTELYI